MSLQVFAIFMNKNKSFRKYIEIINIFIYLINKHFTVGSTNFAIYPSFVIKSNIFLVLYILLEIIYFDY
jgi:hypothetical protein